MLLLALAGVTLGTLGTFACSKWIESLLFGTTPTNPVDFSGVSFLLCAVALVAAYVPARRASRIEPFCRRCAQNETVAGTGLVALLRSPH
jgi:ABC-type lipoprotein release transport system permease subunit